jgi:intracellular septation protein
MPDHAWTKLKLMWVAYFAMIGSVNLYVAYQFPTETWVDFRFWGLYGALLAFMVVQGFFIYQYLPKDEAADDAVDNAAPPAGKDTAKP